MKTFGLLLGHFHIKHRKLFTSYIYFSLYISNTAADINRNMKQQQQKKVSDLQL